MQVRLSAYNPAMPAVDLRVQEALVRLRKARGLTQEQVADAEGTSHGTISRRESAKLNPTIATVERHLEALGATPAEFIEALAALHGLSMVVASRAEAAHELGAELERVIERYIAAREREGSKTGD